MIANRFDTIYFNGSSFTEGGGFEEEKVLLREVYKQKYNFIYTNEKDVSYPSLIQQKFPNIKVINEAKSGGGFDRVIRKVYQYVETKGIQKAQKTIFILEIPGDIQRQDLYSIELDKWIIGNIEFKNDNIKINDTQVVIDWIYGPQIDVNIRDKQRRILKEYTETFLHPGVVAQQSMYKLLGLLSFLNSNNIECYLTGLDQFSAVCKKFIPNFDYKHRIFVKHKNNFYSDIVSLANDNKLAICDEVGKDIITDGHPGFQAHRIWADGICEFLNTKYI